MWKKPTGTMNRNDAIAAMVRSVPEEWRAIAALWGITVIELPVAVLAIVAGAWLR